MPAKDNLKDAMTHEKKQEAIQAAFEASVLRRQPGISLARNGAGDYDNPMVSAMWDCWCEGMAYQSSIGSEDVASTSMTPEQAQRWAWKQVQKDVGIDGWTIGDTCNFMGFFHWGWLMRGQYELQRMALPRKTAVHDILTWRDRVGGYSRSLGEVEQAMAQENDELRKFIALHLSRLAPLAFQLEEFDMEAQASPATDAASRLERAVLDSKADSPELRSLLLAYKTTAGDKQDQALKDVLCFIGSKLARVERVATQRGMSRALCGERISNKTFQTLSSMSTFMSVALTLIPTVSWHDTAVKGCEELKELLDRNFAVQLTTAEGASMRYSAVADKMKMGELVLPPAMQSSDGAAEKYMQGFNACLEKVIAVNGQADPRLQLPKELSWCDSSSADYVVGFNACRNKVQELNLASN